jgi:serine/threonine-protein kinase
MKKCPQCGVEYPDTTTLCPADGIALEKTDDSLIGTTLAGKYRIEERLNEGGMGTVYRATHVLMEKTVAIKVLRPSLAADEKIVARFSREARAASRISHPNALSVTDFGEDENGIVFLVMEFLSGRTLKQVIREEGPLPLTRVVDITRQVGDALHAAHQQGVVHRDLKSDNIMLLDTMTGDHAKVLDFGIAKINEQEGHRDVGLTAPNLVIGTPQYMSPEQACGLREQIDHRSDQFSLAAIAYVLLTGHEPFTGDNPIAVLYEVVNHDPPPPSQINPALGPEVDAVVMRGLAKESADRYPNVLAFASALRAAVHGGVVAAFADPTSEPPPVRTPVPDASVDIQPAPIATGRDTVRLIRRMRWRQSRTPRRFVLLTLVTVAALACLLPTTRQPAQAAWRHAGAQMRIMVERVLPSEEIRH